MKELTDINIVQKWYPEAFREIADKKAISKSKEKNTPLKDFQFFFVIAMVIKTGALENIAKNFRDSVVNDMKSEVSEKAGDTFLKLSDDERRKFLRPIEDVVNERCVNTIVTVEAVKGKSRWFSKPLEVVPMEIKEIYKKGIEKERSEMERVLTLSPEEREKEIAILMKELNKSNGFSAFKIMTSGKV